MSLISQDATGATQRITLVEGTIGSGTDNIGSVEISPTLADNDPFDANKINLTFNSSKYFDHGNASGAIKPSESVVFEKTATGITNQFPEHSGSVQSSLDMLWKDGSTPGVSDARGYGFYRDQLDKLAESFATVINTINIKGSPQVNGADDTTQYLLANKDDGTSKGITAANIGINSQWSNGTVHVGKSGESSNFPLFL